jgi:hypothetical protein
MSLDAGTRFWIRTKLSLRSAPRYGEIYRARDTRLERDVA